MEIINNIVEFFNLTTLSYSATFVDLAEFLIELFCCCFVLVALYRGLIAFLREGIR